MITNSPQVGAQRAAPLLKWTSDKTDYFIAAAVTLLAFFVYLRTLAPTVLPGDSGEFQFAAPLLGIAHPTGYPLYLLLGKLFTLLPIGDVAYRVNLVSAVFAALTVGVLYLISMQTEGTRIVSALTALLFAYSPTFWSQAVIAEVYTLNAFFVALSFYLLLRLPHIDSRLLLFGYGLSLTHHRSMLLLAPAFLVYIWLTARATFRQPRLLPVLIIPLALYLYIPLRAAHTPWLNLRLTATRELALYDNTWRGFWNFVTGSAFGGLLGYRPETLTRLQQTFPLLLTQFGVIGIVLGLRGLAYLVMNRHWRLLALTLLSYLTIIGFCAVYFIDDIAAYYIPSYFVFAIWIGKSANLQMGKWANQRISKFANGQISELANGQMGKWANLQMMILVYLLVLLLASAVGGQLWSNYTQLDQSHNFAARERWQSFLADAPEDAILLTNDRDEMVPLFYYQYIDNRRRDLTGLFPQIAPTAEYADVVSVADTALSTGRPVCFIKPMVGLEIKYQLHPRGSLTCIDRAITTKPPQYPLAANFANTLQLMGMDVGDATTGISVTLHWRVLQTPPTNYVVFVHLLDRGGEKFAQSDHQPGGVYYPPTAWRAGEYLHDTHVITPTRSAFRLVVGVYDSYTMQRLTIVDDGDTPARDYAELSETLILTDLH